MDSRTSTQIRKIITPKEFKKVLYEHPTFLFHLVQENQIYDGYGPSFFISLDHIQIRKEYNGVNVDEFELWLKYINVPYFEMHMKDAVEIMLDFGYPTNYIYNYQHPTPKFERAMLIIHNGKVFYNSQYECYCPERINENLFELNHDFLITPD
jgi:hypothetical protein